MLPKIIDYEDARVKVTVEAYTIPEIKALIDKYDMGVEPYLAYVYLMTYPTSPYRNLETEEKKEEIVYNVNDTLGDFDPEEELLGPALEKMEHLCSTPLSLTVDELEQELHRIRKYLKSTAISDDNLRTRMTYMEKIDKVASAYGKVKEQSDKELEVRMRGKSELGDY
jgi:hypothetical protein